MKVRKKAQTRRSYAVLDLKDDRHRYVVKPADDFADPELAWLLHQVTDPRLPRLFGCTGQVVDRLKSFSFLPYIEPAEIGLDRYRRIAAQPLLLFEYVPGESLDRIDCFTPRMAVALHECFYKLGKRLFGIVRRPVLHLDLKPSNILLTPDGSFCFIDWSIGRVGESIERVKAGTKGYLGDHRAGATLRRDRYALAMTIISLLQEKPAASIHTVDRLLALKVLPKDLRLKLTRDLTYGRRTRIKRQVMKKVRAKTSGSNEPMTVIVIPWEEAENKRNIRISIDE